ncbi:MAG: IgGFc-binding protein [Deltaproteobacteria bacterium]|nr:IgGFc-binding protein [Deltaproteobacteria bacterium]
MAQGFSFGVGIGNSSGVATPVMIDGGELEQPIHLVVPPRSVTMQRLPWLLDLKLCREPGADGCRNPAPGALVAGGAYRIRAHAPVSVYQFNPLDCRLPGAFSISNDASVLIPTNAWGTDYYAAGFSPMHYPSDPPALYGSLMAVVAKEPNTAVVIVTSADTASGDDFPGIRAGVPTTFMLGTGDVVELTSVVGDLTGSRVTSDKPVQVISGHYGAQVPVGVQAADHLEEAMFPIETLGTRYVINAPAIANVLPDGKEQIVRVVATRNDTTLVYTPPQPGAPATIATAGGYVELPSSAASYVLTASAPVLAIQYMEGQRAGGGTGDPAMTLAVPVDQFRTSYAFLAPPNFDQNHLDVTAPTGAHVMLDGIPVELNPIPGTEYSLGRIQELSAGAASDGSHWLEGDVAFGISVYGYAPFTSYWYPGGLNLRPLVQ